ncbi:hypothetical protein BU24DRAFT_417027 [Aaosphaeria arxii CBS 175.79]|uniref:Uncharacterized protein n=1 Tax=Aaosphaeria arxii CBS 175.79 TaxID=1450172 RepID=A0A6A5Y7T9_9PLEO|nr:uncharacterized protein BU24DRAFT_417027 [Aaosphaeria arxii CBS 175.79]KAF2021366.1 hypothetical protein BU24DRAFT_417027 [Aaosphaeria arxii CBS 175.79]
MSENHGNPEFPDEQGMLHMIRTLQLIKKEVAGLEEMAKAELFPSSPPTPSSRRKGEQILEGLQYCIKQYKSAIDSSPPVYPCLSKLAREQAEYKSLQSHGLYELLTFQRTLLYNLDGRSPFPLPKINETLFRRWSFNWTTDGMRHRRMVACRIGLLLSKAEPTSPTGCLDVREQLYYILNNDEGDMQLYQAWENRTKQKIGPKHLWLFDTQVDPDLEWTCLVYATGQLMERETQYRLRMERWEKADRESHGRLQREAKRSGRLEPLRGLSCIWGNNNLISAIDNLLLQVGLPGEVARPW